MEEKTTPELQLETKARGAGCLSEVGWFLSGAVLPMGSLTFYRKAAQRSVGSTILFFIFFTALISTMLSLSFGVTMYSASGGIEDAYAGGSIPEITISQGVAEVGGTQPFILLSGPSSNGQTILVATDTSGTLKRIDTNRFDQGFLLTHTELHMLNRGDYQVIPLSNLHDTFDRDPIIINAETVSRFWKVMAVVLVFVVFIFLTLWYTVIRLMIIATIALVLWGIVSLIKPNTGFGPIIITGLYAIVPAVYLSHLFSRSEISLPGLQTLFLIVFWGIGLAANFMDFTKTSDDQPMRLWTALIGVPMLILYMVDVFWNLPPQGELIALWVITVFTGLTLAGLRLFFRFNKPRALPPPGEPASQS